MIVRYERSKSRKTELILETLRAYTLIIRNINYGNTGIFKMIRKKQRINKLLKLNDQ